MLVEHSDSYKQYFQYFGEILSVLYGRTTVSMKYLEEESEKVINLDSFFKHSRDSEIPPLLIYHTLRCTHISSQRVPHRKEYFKKRCANIFSQLKASIPTNFLKAFDEDVKLHWEELDDIYMYANRNEAYRKLFLRRLERRKLDYTGINWNSLVEWSSNNLESIYDIGNFYTLQQLAKARLFRAFVHLADEYNQVREFLNMEKIDYSAKRGFLHFMNSVLEDVLPTTTNNHYDKAILEGHYKFSHVNSNYLFDYLDEVNKILRLSDAKLCKKKTLCAIFLILYESKVITNCKTFAQCVTILCQFFGRELPKDCRPNKYKNEVDMLKTKYIILERIPTE